MPETTKTTDAKSPKARKIPPVMNPAAEAPPAFTKKVSTPVSKRMKASPPATTVTLSAEERHRRIAEAAYYLAEKRGFQGGSPEQDWFEAAAGVDS